MSIEVRRVPANWEHPKNEKGDYIPHYERPPSYAQEEIEEGLCDGWLDNSLPNYGRNVLPQWPDAERTHYQMYEVTTEGTPISPVMETPEALARWISDNKVSVMATHDEWLEMITGMLVRSYGVSYAAGEIMSGVEAVSRLKG